MADTEETPAQRQARIRRQKREAKINASGADRLEKITKASGRTPESMRNESDFSKSQPTSPPPQNGSFSFQDDFQPSSTPPSGLSQTAAQEEYLKSLLRGSSTAQGPGQNQEQEDPMMKLIGSMFGGQDEQNNPDGSGGPSFSPDDISRLTGMPSFVTESVFGAGRKPPTATEIRNAKIWKTLHMIFAVVTGLYLIYSFDSSIAKFGSDAPAPATAQNPLVVFLTGELLLQGPRIISLENPAQKLLYRAPQIIGDMCRDAGIVIFLWGCVSWWKGIT